MGFKAFIPGHPVRAGLCAKALELLPATQVLKQLYRLSKRGDPLTRAADKAEHRYQPKTPPFDRDVLPAQPPQEEDQRPKGKLHVDGKYLGPSDILFAWITQGPADRPDGLPSDLLC